MSIFAFQEISFYLILAILAFIPSTCLLLYFFSIGNSLLHHGFL